MMDELEALHPEKPEHSTAAPATTTEKATTTQKPATTQKPTTAAKVEEPEVAEVPYWIKKKCSQAEDEDACIEKVLAYMSHKGSGGAGGKGGKKGAVKEGYGQAKTRPAHPVPVGGEGGKGGKGGKKGGKSKGKK